MQGRDIDRIASLESESGIIASLIHRPDFSFYSEQLLPNHFTNQENRIMYQAICELARHGIKTIDAFNITEVLNSSEATRKYTDVVTVDKLQEFIDISSSIARSSVEEYKMLVSSVLDSAFRRDLLVTLNDCCALCTNKSCNDVQKSVYEKIDSVMLDFSMASDDVPEFKDVVDGLWADVIERQEGKNKEIKFVFNELNDYVTIEPGELVIFAAKQKQGKSILMLNEAVDLMKKGESVLYIDSELSDRLFLIRLISHLTKIEFKRIKGGKYSEEEAEKIAKAIDWIKTRKFTHIYMPVLNKDTVYATVKKVIHKFGTLGVLIFDYFKGSGDALDAFASYQELGSLVDTVKNVICGAEGVAGIGAAQLSSGGDRLADSAKIARNASTIVFLTDKSPEEMAEDPNGNKKLTVVNNRNGMQHANGEWINIDFDGNTCSMSCVGNHISEQPY